MTVSAVSMHAQKTSLAAVYVAPKLFLYLTIPNAVTTLEVE